LDVTDIFDEVNEDLRAERAQRLLQRYGYLLIVAAVLITAAVGGWKYWSHRSGRAQAAVADSFMTASREGGATGAKPAELAQAGATFASMARKAPGGYRTLARLREASLKASGGDLPGALALWDQVSSDEAADPDLRRVADMMWVQHEVDGGEAAAVEGRLAPLLAAGPWRPLAMECQALLKLRTGDRDGAVSVLKEIVALPSAPSGVRARATGMLTQLGEVTGGAAPSTEKNG